MCDKRRIGTKNDLDRTSTGKQTVNMNFMTTDSFRFNNIIYDARIYEARRRIHRDERKFRSKIVAYMNNEFCE